jgi:transcriptional regulator of met regulon
MSKFKGKTKDVTVSVSIKTDKLIDDYKVQQYINELTQLIQSHINKG